MRAKPKAAENDINSQHNQCKTIMSLQMSQTKEFLSGLMKEKAFIMQKLEPRKAPPKLRKRRSVEFERKSTVGNSSLAEVCLPSLITLSLFSLNLRFDSYIIKSMRRRKSYVLFYSVKKILHTCTRTLVSIYLPGDLR